MINLRYHIVSITAVFLALGIGIAMGSSFLSDAAVDQVSRNIESTRNEARAARAEAGELRDEAAQRDQRERDERAQAAARLFRDHLDGVPVLLLTVGGVDEESLELLRTALVGSEADYAGTLAITDGVEAVGDDADTVARLLDREGATEGELHTALVEEVAAELMVAAEPPTEDDQEPEGTTTTTTTAPVVPPPTSDPVGTTTTTAPPAVEEPAAPELLRGLVQDGILDFEPAEEGRGIDEVLATPGHRYVIVSGAGAEVSDGDFFRPLLRAMTEDGPAPVVVASAAVGEGAEADRDAVVGPLLAEDVIAARVTTVDDLESLSGLMAVMLGLDDLGRDRRGHYGVGPGADSQLPAP